MDEAGEKVMAWSDMFTPYEDRIAELEEENEKLKSEIGEIQKDNLEICKWFAEKMKRRKGTTFPFTGTVFIEDIDALIEEMESQNEEYTY